MDEHFIFIHASINIMDHQLIYIYIGVDRQNTTANNSALPDHSDWYAMLSINGSLSAASENKGLVLAGNKWILPVILRHARRWGVPGNAGPYNLY